MLWFCALILVGPASVPSVQEFELSKNTPNSTNYQIINILKENQRINPLLGFNTFATLL